jgi:predicted MFS family arabinose efflux permease
LISEAQPDLLTRGRVLLFATTVGTLVANLYYVQPLLATIAASFGRSVTSAGYLVTFVQLGYAAGLLFVVPLGDVLDRRALISAMLGANVGGLLLTAASPNFGVFGIAAFLTGCTSSAAMVTVPYVASKAPDAARGRYIGQVMTGLLLGILLARTVAGLLAAWVGWRCVFLIAAMAVTILIFAMRASLPHEGTRGRLHYPRLMRSLLSLARQEPELRVRAFYTSLGMGSFSMLWTGLTFLLSASPFHYTEAEIGLFGLIGAAGAAAANIAGRLSDRGYTHRSTGSFAFVLLVSWIVLMFGQRSLAAVVVGVFLLDVGAQGLQVTHQSVIYRLAPGARSRITAVYMTSAFIGASIGSALASASFAFAGWTGLSAVGALLPLTLLITWRVRPRVQL